jgi:hypothetical protein
LSSVFDCSQRIHRLLDLLCLASITLSIIVTLLISTLRIQNSAPELAHPKGLLVAHKIWSYWRVCFDVFCSPTIQPQLIWSNMAKGI